MNFSKHFHNLCKHYDLQTLCMCMCVSMCVCEHACVNVLERGLETKTPVLIK